jgi:hypothetical protein
MLKKHSVAKKFFSQYVRTILGTKYHFSPATTIATCPSSPYHMQINGTCIYFEHKELNWQEAMDNCRNASGGLYEPRDSSMNEAIWKAANEKLEKAYAHHFWLGMSRQKDGTIVYR